MSFQKQQRKDVWRNAERHYCAFCNVWMGSDRQSIMIHENGKKHRENVEANLQKRRNDNLKKEKDEKQLEASLRKMEQVAAAAHAKDIIQSGRTTTTTTTSHRQQQQQTHPLSYSIHHQSNHPTTNYHHHHHRPNVQLPSPYNTATGNSSSATTKTTEQQYTNIQPTKDSWQERKRMREVSRGTTQNDLNDDHHENNISSKKTRRNILLGKDEGHYTIDDVTYLEGSIYISIMDQDMPVQIWTGSWTTTKEYRKTKAAQELWKFGIIVKVHKENTENGDSIVKSCDVSFIAKPEDDDETVEKNVAGDRLRLILGSDDIIPSSIEEARLALMGGEEIISYNNNDNTNIELDENTGLSSWGTVTVKKVTVSQEIKNERERLRAKKAEEYQLEKQKVREVEERKMEEAKYANADDSALGAYDVWTAGKSGYKGVKIADDSKVNVTDMAKSLSKGQKNVSFKKKSSLFNKSKKKQNRRTTLSDEDD